MTIKKKILLITSSSKTGGGPSHIFLLKEILKNDFDFYLAMPKINFNENDFELNHYIEISERKITIGDILRIFLFAKRNSVDIIHSHGKGAGLLGRIIKIFLMKPLLHTFHGIHTECLNNVEKIIYILYENITGWIDDEKIFVSQSEYKKAKDQNIFIRKNFSIINNSTKEMEFRGKRIITSNLDIGISNKNKNIISISRLVKQKNIFEIFEIARQLTCYNFLVLGDGYLYLKAKKYLLQNNIENVFLLGNQKDVFKYLYASEAFLSTSLDEGHPISILEAISIGLPVIASNVVGNCDTIEHGVSGFLYKIGNISEAKYFINKTLKIKEINKDLSINAYSIHKNKFTTKKMKKSYLLLYSKY
tara:strand:- start:206 stop:1291 length:1086 start_codon:yes stop_codon:yes gene_type:complete